jgi:hypothetical protein
MKLYLYQVKLQADSRPRGAISPVSYQYHWSVEKPNGIPWRGRMGTYTVVGLWEVEATDLTAALAQAPGAMPAEPEALEDVSTSKGEER